MGSDEAMNAALVALNDLQEKVSVSSTKYFLEIVNTT